MTVKWRNMVDSEVGSVAVLVVGREQMGNEMGVCEVTEDSFLET